MLKSLSASIIDVGVFNSECYSYQGHCRGLLLKLWCLWRLLLMQISLLVSIVMLRSFMVSIIDVEVFVGDFMDYGCSP